MTNMTFLRRPLPMAIIMFAMIATAPAYASQDPCRDHGSQGADWDDYTVEEFSLIFSLDADECSLDLGEITVQLWIRRDAGPLTVLDGRCEPRQPCVVTHSIDHPPLELANYYFGYRWRTHGFNVIGGELHRLTQCQSAVLIARC